MAAVVVPPHTHSRGFLEEVEMETRADMGDPMARADKLRMQKQVLAIFGNVFVSPSEICSGHL